MRHPIGPARGCRLPGREGHPCATLPPVKGEGALHPSMWRVSLPALIVTAPLVGFAFHFDERRLIYRAAGFGHDHPLNAARHGFDSIDTYLEQGNFRPLGRLVEGLIAAFALEAGEATAMAPHAVLGILRLLAVFVLALLCYRIVAALVRSAGLGANSVAGVLYPLVLGMTLVANGRLGPLVHFSFLMIGVVALIFAIPLLVARDSDMQRRPLLWYEPVGMALLGVVAATFYDLVYVAPPLAAAFIVARAVAAGLPARSILRSAACRRWAALSLGFLAVFVPVRTVIAVHCSQESCYTASQVRLSGDILEIMPTRILSATPPAGWALVSGLVQRYGPEFDMLDLAANSLLAMLLLGIAALTAMAATTVTSRAEHQTTGSDYIAGNSPPASRSSRYARLSGALGILGATTVFLSGLLAALSKWIQASGIDYGWRDTVLTQSGWSFLIAAVTVLTIATCRTTKAETIATAATAGLLGVGLVLTLLANARLAQIDRHSTSATVASQISSVTVNFDVSESGNARRCALLDAYAALEPENSWTAAQGVRKDLDRLMLGRYGQPFCRPAPTRTVAAAHNR